MRFCPAIFIFSITISAAQILYGQSNVGSQSEVWPTLKSLRDLPDFQASGASVTRVDFEAVVTYWDLSRCKLFVQDGDQAVFVQLNNTIISSHPFRPKRGCRMRVTGELVKSEGYIVPSTLKVVGAVEKLQPIDIDLANLKRGDQWSRLVTLEGELQRVHSGRVLTRLVLHSGQQRVVCFVHGHERSNEFAELLGGRFRVTGVLDWARYRNGTPRSPICQVMSFDDISIEAIPSLDRPSVNEIRHLAAVAGVENGSRISASGFVTYLN